MKLRILAALLKKEVILMRHNPLIPRVILMLPLMVLLVIPLIANLDVKDVQVAVVDNDHSQLSRRIISDLNATAELHVAGLPATPEQAMAMMDDGRADVIVTIPRRFEQLLTPPDIEANGVNATKGLLGMQYVGASMAGTLAGWRTEQGLPAAADDASVLNLYNPTLNFRHYMIPALMVFLIIMICGFLPSLNLVSEKETGTIEAMNVTPVSRVSFVLSKLIPFWVIGLVVVTLGIIIGRLVYGLAPAGNIGAIYLAAVLLSLFMSGLGVTVANKSATMLQSIFVMFAIVIIFQLMSGLFTPISSMPQWAQTVTYIVPPRYFNEIMRSLYLKGTPISDLWLQYSCLGLFALVSIVLAALTYRKRS